MSSDRAAEAWRVRVGLGVLMAVAAVGLAVRHWVGDRSPDATGHTLFGLAYNVPIFFLFGFWPPTLYGWVRDGRWLAVATAAAVLVVALLRAGLALYPRGRTRGRAGTSSSWPTCSTATRRNWPILILAALVFIEVAAVKLAAGDFRTLGFGLLAGAALDLIARRATRDS